MIRHRTVIVVAIVLITGILAWQATRVGLNADFSTYLSQDDSLVQQYNRIGEIFGGNSTGFALITSNDAFSEENLHLVQKLTEAFSNVEGISYATSLTNVTDFRKTEWGLEIGKLMNRGKIPETPQALAKLKAYVMQKDRLEGNLVSDDATTTAIILKFAASGKNNISQFATSLKVKEAADVVAPADTWPSGTRIYYGGMPFLIFNMTLLITKNFIILLPLMFFVLLLILYLGFRHWTGVVFPLLVVIISDIWIVGLMGIFGLKFDLLSGIVPVVLLALGSADGIHLMKRYFERLKQGDSTSEAARQTFGDMSKPVILTTITTMAGFSSLLISDFAVIKQFGLLAAVGVLLALVITLTLLPALLSFGIAPKSVRMSKRKESAIWKHLATGVYYHKFTILLSAAVVVVFAVIAIPRITTDVDWTLCLAKGSDPLHAEMLLREKFGGSLPIQVLVNGDLKDPAVLKQMRIIERRLETIPLISKSQSIASIIAEMNDAMNDRYTVPVNPAGVANLWFLVEGEDLMEQMVANGDREGLLQAKLATWDTGSLVSAVDSVNTFLTTLPDTIAVVDLNRLPGAIREQFQKIKIDQITVNLMEELQRYGIKAERAQLQEIVSGALEAGMDNDTRQEVIKSVTAYLNSPQAEVELPRAAIKKISRAITANLNGGIPESQEIEELILRQVPRINRDDAAYLSESLSEIVRLTLGRTRIAPALREVRKMLPESFSENATLLRNIYGTLWAINEQQLALDAANARQKLAGNREALIREVNWQVDQTGLAPVLNRMEEELTPTQVESLLTSLVFVIILLTLIHRSILGGLLSVVPIVITVLVNFAVMAYWNIGLDSFTAMIASIAIGLGIDTDIHFVSRLKKELMKDGNELAALQRTFRTTGVSIIINALAVGLGFVVMLAAGGQHIRRFGGLTALTILLSALFTLTVLPSLMLWLKPKFLKKAIAFGVRKSEETPAEVVLQTSSD